MTFQELGLNEPILRALADQGYEQPSPIQAKAIPPALTGRDVLGCAQTGTGKTCAFAAPILQQLSGRKAQGRPIRALILTPTRELALQIQESFEAYGKYLPLRSTVIFGGVGQAPQVERLKNGVDILVATPGRLGDLYGQKPNKPIVALNNTLTGVTEMVEYKPVNSKNELKCKYNITQENILIFCARFENNYRRTDLLIETIKQLNTEKYGFIIIGAGKNKPDFSLYNNVYDFGAIYDTNIKRELFYIADLYFQPGWVGLSIVEAMAYGKPICTFIRSEETKQCVEYSYIENNTNGLIFTNIDDCITRISQLTNDEIKQLGANAKKKVAQLLTPQNMVANALSIL